MGDGPATNGEGVASATPTGRPTQPPEEPVNEGPQGAWRLRNWRLRSKLLAVLLIPSIAALALGGIQVSSDYAAADTLARNATEVELGTSSSNVVQELQRERDLTVDYVASGRSVPADEMAKQRTRTDRAVEKFRADVDQARSGSHPEVATTFGGPAQHLDRLESLRKVTDSSGYPADAVLRTYSDSIGSLLALNEQSVTTINNPELVRFSLAANAVARAKEQESVRRAVLVKSLRAGAFPDGGERELLAAGAERDAALTDFRKWASPEQSQFYSDTVAGLGVDDARSIEETALVRGDSGSGLGGLNPEQWLRSSSDAVDLTYDAGKEVRSQLQAEVNQAAADARTQMYIATALVLGALVLAFAIALLVARSLLLPLRTLRRSALDVADKRLPEAVDSILHEPNAGGAHIKPIPVHTQEEIGRVARSFDEVHSQALRLASEQALLRNNINELFVNLARRSQTLVQRQLSLIDRLEQDEQDPDQLGSLFELDHLATRMRRNSENLLILGGTDLTRRMMRPVPLSEVIGAAVSEVEQYARVVIADAPELALQGRVVNDFVHLVAELLENATSFSNPDTEVGVRTAYRRQALVLEIRDRGVGIDAEEIVEINERLARPPEVDVSISRRMGLYVVAQLARRHNIRVELQNNQDLEGGVTATVYVSGEFIAQLTPDGPKPMPDVQHVADDPRDSSTQRDSLGDSGTHLGLAAAFGQGGAGQGGTGQVGTGQVGTGQVGTPERGFTAEPPTERAALNGSESASSNGHSGPGDADRPAEWPTDYSVQVSSADSFATPRNWTDEDVSDEVSEQVWPSEDSPVPPSDTDLGMSDSGSLDVAEDSVAGHAPDLFNSPFEAEKTTEFRSTDGDWADASQPDASQPDGTDADAPRQAPAREADDAPTERLPIYEAVLSQWFRESDVADSPGSSGLGRARASDFPATSALAGSDRPAPRESASEGAAEIGSTAHAVGGRAQARRAAEQAQQGAESPSEADDPGLRGPAPDQEDPGSQASSDESVAGPNRPESESGEDPGWGSADAGWQAAEALVEQVQQVEETTSAGLPKRVPKTNLVPGSAESKPRSTPKSSTPRSPDAVRGRMSNFQSGIRRGRHAKAEPVSSEQSSSNPSRHEEQE